MIQKTDYSDHLSADLRGLNWFLKALLFCMIILSVIHAIIPKNWLRYVDLHIASSSHNTDDFWDLQSKNRHSSSKFKTVQDLIPVQSSKPFKTSFWSHRWCRNFCRWHDTSRYCHSWMTGCYVPLLMNSPLKTGRSLCTVPAPVEDACITDYSCSGSSLMSSGRDFQKWVIRLQLDPCG